MPFNQARADAACNFFELVLKHSADEWWGKPFILAPWQEEALQKIFGPEDDTGGRLVETAYLEVPKKTGKTEFAAGIILFVLATENAPGLQIYGAAAATRQALNVYRAACKMVEQSPLLKKRLRILRGTNRIVKRKDPDSFYAAIAADGDLGDGVNPSCVVADEVHRWKTRKQLENWDVLSNGGITRRQTLTIAITTAGVQSESPLAWKLHRKTHNLTEGIVSDPKFYGRIYGALATDDVADEKTWIKAIPSLKVNGGFLEIAKIREKYVSHLAEGDLASFKRYFLNIWDQKENRAINLQQWKECGDELRGLVERPCYAGLDLSSTTDLTALTLVFPWDDGTFDILPFFWMAEAKVRTLSIRDKVPYGKWVEDGLMTATEGNVVDYACVKEKIEWCREMFELREIGFDKYNANQLVTETGQGLMDRGFKCVPVSQNFQGMSEPTKKFLELIISKKIRHAGHPVLTFNADCLETKSDGADNIKPVKPDRAKSDKRIDGVVAGIIALSRAMLAGDQTSVYETRGLRVI